MPSRTKKLEHLTAEQTAAMATYRDRWTAYGLDTAPADRPRAEAAIRTIYELANLPTPRIVWCGSPLANALTRSIVQSIKPGEQWASVGDSVWASVWDSVWASVWDSVWDSVRASVWDSVRDSVGASVWASVWDSVGASVRDSVGASVGASVWDSVGASVRDSVGASVGASVWDSVRDSVRDSVGASVWDSVWASVWDSVGASVGASVWDSVGASVRDSVGASVWDSVGDSVWDSVRDSVGASVRDSVRDSVRASVYGQHDANWLAFYAFFRDECGLTKQTEPAIGLMELCQSAGWALPHQNICWVSERPEVVRLEPVPNGRAFLMQLHCEDGPAVRYRDGWSIWAWHGTRVPQRIIEQPETITAQEILKEQNAEVRRVMLERMGIGAFVCDANPEVLHEDRDGADQQRRLLAVKVSWARGGKMVVCHVVCPSTGHEHLLPVPPTTKRCDDAIAWTFGLQREQYAPLVEA